MFLKNSTYLKMEIEGQEQDKCFHVLNDIYRDLKANILHEMVLFLPRSLNQTFMIKLKIVIIRYVS